MPDLVLPSPWPQFLAEVDQSLSAAVELHCVGGFVLTAVYEISRSTADLDYVSVIPRQLGEELEKLAGRDSALAKKQRVFLQAVGIADLPGNYEERLQTLPLHLKKITLRAPDPYDLILSKLTRNSPKDMEDVKALAQKLHLRFDVLMERFEREMVVPNRRWHEQTLNVVWKEYFEI
ncbi:MAG: hypothetical protein HY233_13345 [Acidobacteriales bacterium]|nr:hypothetical protein [Terriglobales bacterium]